MGLEGRILIVCREPLGLIHNDGRVAAIDAKNRGADVDDPRDRIGQSIRQIRHHPKDRQCEEDEEAVCGSKDRGHGKIP